jgi:methionyl-tRNA synthetase
MSKNDEFYLTYAIPYVNARPHIGHVLGFLQGDVLARHYRHNGRKVFYVSGADENSLKIVRAAEEEGLSYQEFADKHAKHFQDFLEAYHVSLDKFMRSSSAEHHKVAQDFWKKCEESGDIYKEEYEGLYCVSCEVFYEKSELDKGECLYHPGKEIEKVKEENYFFKLSKYQDKLVELIESDTYKIAPESRKNEALAFIGRGLKDFSISRSKERARGWGVPVSSDKDHVMYVWFDALNVYRSAAPHYWPADLHIIGKDILRFHAIYWPAMLLSAGESLPKELFVHGFITSGGRKMSKSLGNVVDPIEMVKKYGVDAVRYYLLSEIPPDDDGDFNEERFKEVYNADLANGIGNFTSRVLALADGKNYELKINNIELEKILNEGRARGIECIEGKKFNLALDEIWKLVREGDKLVNDAKPWEIEDGKDKQAIIAELVIILDTVAELLEPFLPDTAFKIASAIKKDGNAVSCRKLDKPLFPRL